jgi:hypothetical protein
MRYLWTHAWGLRSPGNAAETRRRIDSLVEFAVEHFNVLLVSTCDLGRDRDGYSLGASSRLRVAGERIDGKTPWEYLYQRAHAAGLVVHSWWVVGLWAAWRALTEPIEARWNMAGMPAPCNAGDAWVYLDNYWARKAIVEAVADFGQRNPVDGVILDYIRYHWEAAACTATSPSGPTDVVRQVHTALPGVPLSVATVGSCIPPGYGGGTVENTKQDVAGWLTEGLIGEAVLMAYHRPVSIRDSWIKAQPGHIVPGFSIEPAMPEQETIGYLREFRAGGYGEHLAVFGWPWIAEKSAFLTELGKLAPPAPPTVTLPAAAVEAAREALAAAGLALRDRAAALEAGAADLREMAAGLARAGEGLGGE